MFQTAFLASCQRTFINFIPNNITRVYISLIGQNNYRVRVDRFLAITAGVFVDIE